MRALVTGASGLLGGYLVRALLAAGYSVRALVRKSSHLHGLQGLNVDKVFGDVRDGVAVRQAADGCEVIFHAAALFAYSGYSRQDMHSTARDGARNIVEAAHDARAKRVVLTSSTVVLGGSNKPLVLNEQAQLRERGAPEYFVTKAIEERVALARARELGVELVVVNPSAFIGPQEGSRTASPSLSTITGYLLDPLKVTYQGGINLSHVSDIAQGHLLMSQRGTPYERHILGGENCTWRDLHRHIAAICGVPTPRLQVGRTLAYAGGAMMELLSLFTRKPPLANRALASQVGTYFWYDQSKAAALGYQPRSAQQTLMETMPWLMSSGFLPARLVRKLQAATAGT